MNFPLKMALKSQGFHDQSIQKTVMEIFLPKLMPMAQKQVAAILEPIEDTPCAQAMNTYIRSLINKTPSLWALRMLDATAKAPQGLLAGGWALLGEYDECLATSAPSFQGQYCLMTGCLSADPDSTCSEDHRESPLWASIAKGEEASQWDGDLWAPLAFVLEKDEGLMELPVHAGVCVPSLCSAADVTAMAAKVAALVAPNEASMIHLEARACHVADTQVIDTAGTFALLLMFGLFLVVAASTVYDYATRERKRRYARLLLAFSAARNGSRLLKTEERGDALPALAGLRVLSVLWVVLHHALLLAGRLPLGNGQLYLKELRQPSAALVTGGFLGLDTLLLLDGLLLAYVSLRRSSAGRRFSLAAHYFAHFARFLPSVALVLLLQSTILLKAGGGPLWHLQPDQQCPDTWPYILLQVCNYFRPKTVQCMEHAWFLSLEWQLYALAPLALWLVQRSARTGQCAMVALAAVGVGARFSLAWEERLQAPWGSYFTKESLQTLYFPTHVRFTPYVLGIVLGYELHRMKHLEIPVRFSKRTIFLLQLTWPVLLIGSLISVHKFSDPGLESQSEPFLKALHLALVHTTWVLGVAIFVFLAAAGKPTLGVCILSFGVWRPLSRLAFGVYLLHLPFLNSVTYDTRFALHLSLWRQVATGLLAFGATLAPAAALWLALQAPMGHVEALLCSPPKGERKRLGNETSAAEKLDYIRVPCEIGEKTDINGVH